MLEGDPLEPLTQSLTALRQAAATELARREDAWRPHALALAEWLPNAQQAQNAAESLKNLKSAEKWLKAAADTLRNERFAPIAQETRRIWDQLRLQSNVSLDDTRRSKDPVSRYLDDAFALAKTDDLPPDIARRVIPGLCREALEAACMETVRRRPPSPRRPRPLRRHGPCRRGHDEDQQGRRTPRRRHLHGLQCRRHGELGVVPIDLIRQRRPQRDDVTIVVVRCPQRP